MCNLYSYMKQRAEAAWMARVTRDYGSNRPPQPAIYPDYEAPIIHRDETGERVMRDVRWGLPAPFFVLKKAAQDRAAKLDAKGKPYDFDELLRLEPDGGTTNVRNTKLAHWTKWLGPENRCLVPFTSFSEPDQAGGSKQWMWFAFNEDRPVGFFAGVWVKDWTCVRKIKEGEVTCDLFGFLTTDANAEVGAVHPKAMPVILTTEADRDLWLSDASWEAVQHLQRPLPDGSLQLVARGGRQDDVVPA